MTAIKHDAGKPKVSLIPSTAILAEARALTKGLEKYAAHNWRQAGGMEWTRLIDSAMRHILAFADGKDRDDGDGGTGELHITNARACLGFLIDYYERNYGIDDRYKHDNDTEYRVMVYDHLTDRTTMLERVQGVRAAVARMNALRELHPSLLLYIEEVCE